MKRPTYEKLTDRIPSNTSLKSMNYDEISRIVDKIIRPEDEDGFLIKRFDIPSSMTVIDLDFKGRK